MMIDLDFAENNAFSGALGVKCTEKGTAFRVWQPLAESVCLRLYKDGALVKSHNMRKNGGVFECRVRGDLDGMGYAFSVTRNGATVESPDAYAKQVSKDGSRGIVTDMRRHAPKGWERDRALSFPNPEAAVIYELSVRDFSIDGSADFKNRGKFTALCESAKNSYGERVGLPYIKKLGATHIQLMPVFDFDMDGAEYNWGYNPRFYNAPAAYYSQTDGVCELRAAVMAAHKIGLGVVADVVYNHVFDAESSAFGKTFPEYYFRRDESGEYSNGSGCGSEFASECEMAGKFIADSLVFLAREYHLDGFRFDLMGVLDIETLKAAEKRLRRINPDILLYGEGWTGGACALDESRRAVLSNARELPRFAFFNDTLRDAVKGSVFNSADCGFVNGSADDWHYERIQAALSGEYPENFWTGNPLQIVNYVECHDNLTLFDKLTLTLPDSESVKFCDKMAAAIVFLSRGMAFIQAGQEFLRSKSGECNSYNLPDSVNSVKWNQLSENADIADYYRGLIAIRKKYLSEFRNCEFTRLGSGFMMTAGELILLISPTEELLQPHIRGRFGILADKDRASDKPLYTARELICEGYSILLAKKA